MSKTLMLVWIATLTGCATTQRVVVIPSDREVKSMKAGVPYVPPTDGWYVPNVRFLEIMNALDKSRIAK